MELFIDSANVHDIRFFAEAGLISGVTTNPSLLAAQGGDPIKTLKEICGICDGPISAEVMADDAESMVKQGVKLSKIADNIVIKVPLTYEGLKACCALREKHDLFVNVTLCFSVGQALMAQQAGATWVSPFIGRLDDSGVDGSKVLGDIVKVLRGELGSTNTLAASIRHVDHVMKAAEAGAEYATVPAEVLKQLLDHPLTDAGMSRFKADWHAAGFKI